MGCRRWIGVIGNNSMNIKDFAKLARRNPKIILGPTEITENRLKCLCLFLLNSIMFSPRLARNVWFFVKRDHPAISFYNLNSLSSRRVMKELSWSHFSCFCSGNSRWSTSSMYRLHGGDSVRVKQTQRDAIVTLDAGTSGNILLYGSKNKRDFVH